MVPSQTFLSRDLDIVFAVCHYEQKTIISRMDNFHPKHALGAGPNGICAEGGSGGGGPSTLSADREKIVATSQEGDTR